MVTIELSLNIHHVGPRIALGAAASPVCAVNIEVGLDSPDFDGPTATDADRETWARRLLPWALLHEPGQQKAFALIILANGNVASSHVVTSPVLSPGRFEKKLIEEIEKNALALVKDRKISFGRPVGGGHEENTLDPDAADFAIPWVGLSAMLAAYPTSLSRALKCRWLISPPVTTLQEAVTNLPGQLLRFIVAPMSIAGENGPIGLNIANTVGSAAGHKVTLAYDNPATTETATAYSYSRDVVEFLAGVASGPLKDYWLDVTDSRADTLADVETILAKSVSPRDIVAMLGEKDLAGVLTRVPPGKPVLPAEIAKVYRAVSEAAAAEDPEKHARDFLRRMADALGTLPLTDALTDQLARFWQIKVDLYRETKGTKLPDFKVDLNDAKVLLEPVASRLLRVDAGDRPVLPNEGIDFLVGEPEDRLAGETPSTATDLDDFNEMAEFGVLVRRAATVANLPGRPWRMVSGGLPLVDPKGRLAEHPWGAALTLPGADADSPFCADYLVARGIALAFRDGLLRNDDTYRGELMLGQSALAFAHEHEAQGESAGGDIALANLSYVAPLARLAPPPPGGKNMLAPPLRYGDAYELAAFLIDRAGGLPEELCGPGQSFDPVKLETLKVPRSFSLVFDRRVPVGDLNVLPGLEKLVGETKDEWPTIPAGVSLRCMEWVLGASALPKRERTPSLLFGPTNWKGCLDRYQFRVEPPRIDEFTFQRWETPEIGGDPVAMRKELTRIARKRIAHNQDTSKDNAFLLPHDPAVSGIQIRQQMTTPGTVHAGDPANRVIPFVARIDIANDVGDYEKMPIVLTCGPLAEKPEIAIPAAGSFSIVHIDVLIRETDYARLDLAALKYPTPDPAKLVKDDKGNLYYALPGQTLLLECATKEMPKEEALFNAFTVLPDANGRMIVSFSADALKGMKEKDDLKEALKYVDRFEIDRQRWVWRNLPHVPADSGEPEDLPRRRLASGLPFGLSRATSCDTDPNVLKFDAACDLSRNFTTRSTVADRWPRDETGAIRSAAVLLADDRDGLTAADYLRYRLKVFSRYASIPGFPVASVTATPGAKVARLEEAQGDWRRSATPYRGANQPRALNVLAVLPLTATPSQDERQAPAVGAGATPFLVLLDEIWHREYGPGEILRAELALEDKEIGEYEDEARPLRYGPMPHKHIDPRPGHKDMWGTDAEADGETAKAVGLQLDCFGPFGYTMDRSATDALANVSAFVVYMPPDVAPQWSVAVRFRRVLAGLESRADGTLVLASAKGAPSSNYLLYTIPDAGGLVSQTDTQATTPPKLALTRSPAGLAYSFDNATDKLAPYAGAPQAVQDQYAYLLLVGPLLRDGGRRVDAFLPKWGVWLKGGGVADEIEILGASAEELRGQILEIELAPGGPDLAAGSTFKEVLRNLLAIEREKPGAPPNPANRKDAPGRITRISAQMIVTI